MLKLRRGKKGEAKDEKDEDGFGIGGCGCLRDGFCRKCIS